MCVLVDCVGLCDVRVAVDCVGVCDVRVGGLCRGVCCACWWIV
jgi:hypothetical protein